MQQLDYKSIAGLVDAAQAAGEAVSAVVLRQQAAELSQSEEQVYQEMLARYRVMAGCIGPGCAPDLKSTSGLTGGGAFKVRRAVEAGLPTVAECGGFLYLGQTLEDDAGTAHPMAGVLPGQGFRVGRLVRFGYAALTPQADSMLFRAGEPVPVHEFHHWDSTCNGTAFAAQKANGRHWDCGFANGHLYAGFPHLYWAGTPLPQRFVTAAAQYAQTKTGRTV